MAIPPRFVRGLGRHLFRSMRDLGRVPGPGAKRPTELSLPSRSVSHRVFFRRTLRVDQRRFRVLCQERTRSRTAIPAAARVAPPASANPATMRTWCCVAAPQSSTHALTMSAPRYPRPAHLAPFTLLSFPRPDTGEPGQSCAPLWGSDPTNGPPDARSQEPASVLDPPPLALAARALPTCVPAGIGRGRAPPAGRHIGLPTGEGGGQTLLCSRLS